MPDRPSLPVLSNLLGQFTMSPSGSSMSPSGSPPSYRSRAGSLPLAARLRSEQPRISRWPAARFGRKLFRRGDIAGLPGPGSCHRHLRFPSPARQVPSRERHGPSSRRSSAYSIAVRGLCRMETAAGLGFKGQ